MGKKSQRYIVGAAGGSLLGFVILHPLSMVFQGLVFPHPALDFSVLNHAFEMRHLSMAMFFGILGLSIGICIVWLQNAVFAEKARVEILEGLLPICSYCKKIKEGPLEDPEKGEWVKIEQYIKARSNADFSHGVCPDCFKMMMEEIDKV